MVDGWVVGIALLLDVVLGAGKEGVGLWRGILVGVRHCGV